MPFSRKKVRRKSRFHGAIGVLWAILVGSVVPAVAGEGRLRFVFITCCRDEAFFGPVKQGLRDAARAMDVECDFIGTPGVDVVAQAALVRKALAEGYHGIALNIIDPVAFDEVVREARQKGVPVVAFNTDDRRTPNARLAGICQNYYEAGLALGRAATFIPSGSKVLLTQHDRGISALDDRLRGLQDALRQRKITWKVICSTNEPDRATQIIAAELQADPQIRFVLGTGLTDTEAAGHAIERHFAGKGYAAAGFDLTPEILRMLRSGVLRITVDQQPYAQGFYPVVQLALYCRFGIMPCDLDAGATLVTNRDVDRLLDLTRKGYR